MQAKNMKSTETSHKTAYELMWEEDGLKPSENTKTLLSLMSDEMVKEYYGK